MDVINEYEAGHRHMFSDSSGNDSFPVPSHLHMLTDS